MPPTYRSVPVEFDDPSVPRMFRASANWGNYWRQVMRRGYVTKKYARGRHGRTNQYLKHKAR